MPRALTVGLVVLSLLAGCAQVPTGKSVDDQLHNAIALDNDGFVRQAVQSGQMSVNQLVRTPGFPEGAPLIVVAARYASLNVLRYLISARADINIRTQSGETALMLASYFNEEGRGSNERHEQAVRMLVEAGASLENDPHHYTPLAYAAHQGHLRIVRYLVERGARVNGDAEDGITYVNTPLMMAAIQGHVDTAVWLLAAGADARVRVHQGHTAAELAQKYNNRNLVGTLRCAETLSPGEKFAQKCSGR